MNAERRPTEAERRNRSHPNTSRRVRQCQVCQYAPALYRVAARNFSDGEAPGTVWDACRSCWLDEQIRAGMWGGGR